MGLMEPRIVGTKSEQAIAAAMTKPWYQKIESWLIVANIVALIVNTLLIFRGTSSPSNIRAQCFAEAEFTPQAINTADDAQRYKFIDEYYKSCLHRMGVE